MGFVDVIHAGAAHTGVVQREAAGLDDVDVAAKAGRQAQARTEILGDIGLIEDEVEHGALVSEKPRNSTIHYSSSTIHRSPVLTRRATASSTRQDTCFCLEDL